ncbi:hypothetical protein BN1708_014543 [Verticillium longisporum]|uniref:EVE domain-containing protein n=3 Tax=Verticillium longisporum TaxID=100787 RepID=A0A0G4LYB4_VERLO|nr:hypothetical protein BN1708_014543 [Verticillium longisporum]
MKRFYYSARISIKDAPRLNFPCFMAHRRSYSNLLSADRANRANRMTRGRSFSNVTRNMTVSAASRKSLKRETSKADKAFLWDNGVKLERKAGKCLLWVLKACPHRTIQGRRAGFSIDDCGDEPLAVEGIRSYPSQSLMRQMKVGDRVLILHAASDSPSIAGIVTVSREKSPDYSACDNNSPYYDIRQGNCYARNVDIDRLDFISIHVTLERKFNSPVGLGRIRSAQHEHIFDSMQVLKQPQMIVSSIGQDAWDAIVAIDAAQSFMNAKEPTL